MDALVQYSSDSDQDDTPSNPVPAPTKLPSADALFDGGPAAPLLAQPATGVKRPTPPSALAARKPPTKLQRGAKQPSNALLPPQLKGRHVAGYQPVHPSRAVTGAMW